MPTFQQIEVKLSKDCLDGKPLVSGGKVIVRWGDGTSSTHVAEVVSKPTDGCDTVLLESVGKRRKVDRIPHVTEERAFVIVKHKGIDLRVALRDSGLYLMRDE